MTKKLICLGLVLLLSTCLQAQEEKEKQKKEVVLPELTEIKKELVAIRKLEFKEDVPSAVQSKEGFEQMIRAELDKSFPLKKRNDIILGLIRLGLVKEKFDLGEGFISALSTQAAAYYDPSENKFYYLMVDLDKATIDTTASHELVHAIQDQHFDLEKVFGQVEKEGQEVRNEDAILAARFLVEGEATYVQMIWQMKKMNGMDLIANPMQENMVFAMMNNMSFDAMITMSKMALGQLDPKSSMAKSIAAMETIPPYILRPLMSAYVNGAYFVSQVRQAGGWDAVNALFKNLPESSEQALHPEKYITTKDAPSLIPVEKLKSIKGLERVDAAIFGEFYLRVLFELQGVELSEAKASTEGWDADLYQAYKIEEGKIGFSFVSVWDTELDAKQFLESYQKVLVKKYPDLKYIGIDKLEKNGTLKFSCSNDKLDFGALLIKDRVVYLVEGFSEVQLDAMILDLLALKIEFKE